MLCDFLNVFLDVQKKIGGRRVWFSRRPESWEPVFVVLHIIWRTQQIILYKVKKVNFLCTKKYKLKKVR